MFPRLITGPWLSCQVWPVETKPCQLLSSRRRDWVHLQSLRAETSQTFASSDGHPPGAPALAGAGARGLRPSGRSFQKNHCKITLTIRGSMFLHSGASAFAPNIHVLMFSVRRGGLANESKIGAYNPRDWMNFWHL